MDGEKFVGIFTTWSPDMDIVLEQCHRVDSDKHPGGGHIDADSVRPKMVFKANTIVRYFVADVDLEYCTKKGKLTDYRPINV